MLNIFRLTKIRLKLKWIVCRAVRSSVYQVIANREFLHDRFNIFAVLFRWDYLTVERSPRDEREVEEGLTKRDELSLRTVLALPKASRTGLVWTTWSSREPFFCWAASSVFLVEAPTVAKYAITFFVFSVFPAPDSPVINMDWFSLSVDDGRRVRYPGRSAETDTAESATKFCPRSARKRMTLRSNPPSKLINRRRVVTFSTFKLF